jgi:hypothetical protein
MKITLIYNDFKKDIDIDLFKKIGFLQESILNYCSLIIYNIEKTDIIFENNDFYTFGSDYMLFEDFFNNFLINRIEAYKKFNNSEDDDKNKIFSIVDNIYFNVSIKNNDDINKYKIDDNIIDSFLKIKNIIIYDRKRDDLGNVIKNNYIIDRYTKWYQIYENENYINYYNSNIMRFPFNSFLQNILRVHNPSNVENEISDNENETIDNNDVNNIVNSIINDNIDNDLDQIKSNDISNININHANLNLDDIDNNNSIDNNINLELQSNSELLQDTGALLENNDKLLENNDKLLENNDELIENSDELIENSDELLQNNDENIQNNNINQDINRFINIFDNFINNSNNTQNLNNSYLNILNENINIINLLNQINVETTSGNNDLPDLVPFFGFDDIYIPTSVYYPTSININQNINEDVIVALTEEEFNKNKSDEYNTLNLEENKCSECLICMEKFNKEDIVTQIKCKHIFHKICIKPWLCEQSNKCPICRVEVGDGIPINI